MATTTNLTALKINYLTQQQYDTALANGQINSDELYLTPQGPSTPASHTHGNIGNTGIVTATVTIANGDRILITDSSDSHKVVGSSISFDGSTTTKALTQKGTWETFASSTHTHTTAITSSTSTPTITLAASTTYKLTAGGTDFIFKTPADNNTTYTPATSVTAVGTSSVTGTSTNYARQDHVHNITLATGDNNGQVKIAGTNVSVKGLGTAAYTASTAYATSDHTHTLTIAADSGTSAITLAHGTKYKLTAGGSTLIFTTPSDNNTDVNVRQQLYAQNYNLPLLMAYQTNTNTTTNVDNIAFRNNSIYANPSTGLVAATQYKVNEAVTLKYNSTTKSLDFIFV